MKTLKLISRYAGVAAGAAYILLTSGLGAAEPGIFAVEKLAERLRQPASEPSRGAVYNLGCILTAALLALFYAGLGQWYRGRLRGEKIHGVHDRRAGVRDGRGGMPCRGVRHSGWA